MAHGMIKHSDMLRRMEHGEVFTLEFVKFDRKHQTGGELVTLENCRKHQAGRASAPTSTAVVPGAALNSRNPNHTKNGTINIKKANGELCKVHTRLITKFNQLEVAL